MEVHREMDNGFDEVIVPISKLVNPLEDKRAWPPVRDEIRSWGFSIRSTIHFAETVRPLSGSDADFGLIKFYVQRAMARVSQPGVRICGIYGGYFRHGDGLSRTRAIDQTIRSYLVKRKLSPLKSSPRSRS